MVMNLDVNFPLRCEYVEGNCRLPVGKLERILKEIGKGRLHQRTVRPNGQGRIHGENRQCAPPCSRLQMCCALGVSNERPHGEYLAVPQRFPAVPL